MCFNKKNKIHNSDQHRKHLVLCFVSMLKHQKRPREASAELLNGFGSAASAHLPKAHPTQTWNQANLSDAGSVSHLHLKPIANLDWWQTDLIKQQQQKKKAEALHVPHKMRFPNIRQLRKALNHLRVHICLSLYLWTQNYGNLHLIKIFKWRRILLFH